LVGQLLLLSEPIESKRFRPWSLPDEAALHLACSRSPSFAFFPGSAGFPDSLRACATADLHLGRCATQRRLVHDVVYDDVCVRDSPNPITLDTGYTAAGTVEGNSPPTMRDITLHHVRVSGGGKISFNAYAKDYRVGAILDDVLLTDSAAYTYAIHHADLVFGPGSVNLKPVGGVDSTLQGKSGSGRSESCAYKFVPFPHE
jgi:hypothetical protein